MAGLPGAAGASTTTALYFEKFPNGTQISNGTVIRWEFASSHDVRFPDGVQVHDCGSSSACDGARSGSRMAMGVPSTEFDWQPIEMTFERLMSSVSFYPELAYNSGSTSAQVEATAYDTDGWVVDQATPTFTSDGSWSTPVKLTTAGDSIARVVITGGPATDDGTTNRIAIDDLTLIRQKDTAGPSDSTPPVVSIWSPASGATVDSEPVRATIQVTDDVDVATVDLRVVHLASGHVVVDYGTGNVCGASTACRSPEHIDDVQVPLDPNRPGEYRYSFRGCDGSGNCAETSNRLVFEPAPDPDPVRVAAVEVNQAVQGWLERDVPRAGSTSTPYDYRAQVPLLPGRATVVRAYPVSEGAARGDVWASLHLTIRYADGSASSHVLRPNDGQPSVTAPPDAGDTLREQLLVMRTDPDATLDYVIPPQWLEDARSFTFHFEGVVDTDRMRAELERETKLWMNVVYAYQGPRSRGDFVRRRTVDDVLLPALGVTMPVGEARVLSERWFDWDGAYAFGDDCDALLFDTWWAYGGYDAPVRPMTLDPVWVPTVGLYPDFEGCGGQAYLGDPADWDDRIGETLISMPNAEVLAHEIGHTTGLLHASNRHNEGDGGGFEPWPYRHGAMAPPDGTAAHRSFGIVPEVAAAPSEDAPAGTWDLTVLDACPTTILAERVPTCTLSDPTADGELGLQHELMSYGSGGRAPGKLSTDDRAWPSDRTYTRMRRAIDDVPPCDDVDRFFGHCGSSGAYAPSSAGGEGFEPQAADEHADALLVGGVVTDGGVELFPLLRKTLPPGSVEPSSTGAYELRLRSAAGTTLVTHRFDALGADGAFGESVPWHEQAASLVVLKAGTVVAEVAATSGLPSATITRLEALPSGDAVVEWNVSDSDGDPLHSYVQISADGGRTWRGLATRRPGGSRSSEFTVAGHAIDGEILVRVTAADGFNTGTSEPQRLYIPAGRAISDACPDGDVPSAGFADVGEGNVHAESIDCALWWELTRGTSATTYSPRAGVTRAQMASFIARLVDSSGGSLPDNPPDAFDDDNGNVHEENINRLAAAGIVAGRGARRYDPSAIVTRAQMGTFLVRAYEHRAERSLPSSIDYFADDGGSVHEHNINKAAEAGFAAGTGGATYQPGAGVRRDQMASFLLRVLDLLVQEGTAPGRT